MRRTLLTSLTLVAIGLFAGCSDPLEPQPRQEAIAPQAAAAAQSCWGQATKVFARMGEMGAHASQEPTPRAGLANLARLLYDAGIIAEPTMQALGAFVAADLLLSIDACMS